VAALITEYQKTHPKVVITYVKQSPLNYRTRLQVQIREAVGPDVFKIHNSWTDMFLADLHSAPGNIFSSIEYQSSFYPIAQESFIRDKQILAVPTGIDGLALYYNEDILSGVGLPPPKSWSELVETATKVTVRDSSGNIKTAGVALGSTKNIDYWPEILGLLLLQQPGVNFQNLNSPQVAEVIRFYTGFITDPKKKTWDINLPSSSQMFEQGNLAFYFGPSGKAYEIKKINPNLRFRVVPVPQLPGRQIAWGSFWAEAVSINSSHQRESWEFIKFLTSSPAQRLSYEIHQQRGLPSKAFSRVDLAPELVDDVTLGAYILQGPYYKSWYLNSDTLDNGLNDEIIKLMQEVVESVLSGQESNTPLQRIDGEVKQIIQKYTQPVAP